MEPQKIDQKTLEIARGALGTPYESLTREQRAALEAAFGSAPTSSAVRGWDHVKPGEALVKVRVTVAPRSDAAGNRYEGYFAVQRYFPQGQTETVVTASQLEHLKTDGNLHCALVGEATDAEWEAVKVLEHQRRGKKYEPPKDSSYWRDAERQLLAKPEDPDGSESGKKTTTSRRA